MTILVRFAAALCRFWTALYTAGLPDGARSARRAEIASDLWESMHADGRSAAVAVSMLRRLLCGAPHDLLWRMEAHRLLRLSRRSIFTLGAAMALLVTVAWTWMTLRIVLPEPAPAMQFIASPAPPPPPPPPPPDWYLKQDAQVAPERSHDPHR